MHSLGKIRVVALVGCAAMLTMPVSRAGAAGGGTTTSYGGQASELRQKGGTTTSYGGQASSLAVVSAYVRLALLSATLVTPPLPPAHRAAAPVGGRGRVCVPPGVYPAQLGTVRVTNRVAPK